MRAENIEQIREHLARGGRAIYGNQWVVEAVTATGRVLLGNGNYLESYTFDSRDWELLPIEETPEERQAWIEKAEHDFPIDFEKTKHRLQVKKRLADMPEHVRRSVDSVIPPINISKEQIKMYPKQQQLHFAALCIAGDLKYLRDQLTEKDFSDNPKLIMLALDSIAIRAEALGEGLLMMHIQKDEPQAEINP